MKMLKTQELAVKNSRQISIFTRTVGAAFAAFIVANSTLGGAPSPFIAALVGALNPFEAIFAFIGAMLAYFFNGKLSQCLIEISAVVMILFIKIISSEFFHKNLKAAGSAIITGVSYIICSLTIIFFTVSQSGAASFVAVCKGIICACAAYFMILAYNSSKEEGRLATSGTAGASLGIIFIFLVATMCSIQLEFLNFGRIFGIFAILFAARRNKHAAGALCGALVTCGTVIYSAETGKAAMLLAVSGIVAGLFADFGSLAMSFFFIASTAAGVILIGADLNTAKILLDSAVAAIAFVAVPEKIINDFLGLGASCKSNAKAVELAASKLGFAAKTIFDVKKSVEQVSKALEKRNKENDPAICVCDKVCGKCRNNLYCWENEFDKFFDAFSEIKKILDEKGKVSAADLPKSLDKCFKRDEIVLAFNEFFADEIAERKANQRLKEMRTLLFEQFDGMGNMLEEIGRDIFYSKECDENFSKSVKDFLADNGAICARACVFFNSLNKIQIEAFYEGKLKCPPEEVSEYISEIADREFEIPQIFRAGEISKLCIMEKAEYKIETAISKRAGSNKETSGDSCEHFSDGQGGSYIIISDGMGSGKTAAVDSFMTISLLIRLLKAGIGFPAAVKLINSSLSVKSNDESFATLDFASINLYTGRLDLLKLGAAPSFVKIGGRVISVEASSLPIGILSDLNADKRSILLKDGDILVMASDGIRDDGHKKIREILLKNGEKSPQEIADEIMRCAFDEESCAKKDDATVAVIKISKNIK
jgi:stage II sporulation protein E